MTREEKDMLVEKATANLKELIEKKMEGLRILEERIKHAKRKD